MRTPLFVLKALVSLIWISLIVPDVIYAYDWPLKPFAGPHPINATLGEYRSTKTEDHFHSGVDIGGTDGTKVYPIASGTVILFGSGSDRGVKVGNYQYIHLTSRPTPGTFVTAFSDTVGVIASDQGHVHFMEKSGSDWINPLRNGGLNNYADTKRTYVYTLDFYKQGTKEPLSSSLYGKVDILSRAKDEQSNGSSNVGIYRIGYQVADSNDTSNILVGPLYHIQFDNITAKLDLVYDTGLSNTTTYYYWVTNGMNQDRYWNTKLKTGEAWNGIDANTNTEAAYPDGKYDVSVLAYDIKNNVSVQVSGVRYQVLPGMQPVAALKRLKNRIHPQASPALVFLGLS